MCRYAVRSVKCTPYFSCTHECVFLSFHVLLSRQAGVNCKRTCRDRFLYVSLGWPCKRVAACHLSFKNVTVYRNIKSPKIEALLQALCHRSTRAEIPGSWLYVCTFNYCSVVLDTKFFVCGEHINESCCNWTSLCRTKICFNPKNLKANHRAHRINMELDLQSLFGLRVHSCIHWLRDPAFGLIYEGAIGQPR
jgi:hypothetical protein